MKMQFLEGQFELFERSVPSEPEKDFLLLSFGDLFINQMDEESVAYYEYMTVDGPEVGYGSVHQLTPAGATVLGISGYTDGQEVAVIYQGPDVNHSSLSMLAIMANNGNKEAGKLFDQMMRQAA